MEARHISQIKDLPIHELTDEEIVKAAMHRLKSKGVVFMYIGDDNREYWFTRYRNARGKYITNQVMEALKKFYTKFETYKKIKNER